MGFAKPEEFMGHGTGLQYQHGEWRHTLTSRRQETLCDALCNCIGLLKRSAVDECPTAGQEHT